MRISVLTAALALAVMVAGAAPALAHGWVAPYIPQGASDFPAGQFTPGGAADDPFTGPVGGTDPLPDTTPPVEEGPGGGDVARELRQRRARDVGTAARPVGRARPRYKAKGSAAPWASLVRVAWRSSFLPVEARPGYEGRRLEIAEALKRRPADGGWARGDRGALVLVYDPSDAAQRKALELLEADTRFVAAASLFDCFRVDGRSLPEGAVTPRLCVYRRDGTKAGEVRGRRNLRRVGEVLAKTFAADFGRDAGEAVVTARRALDQIARAEHGIRTLEVGIVCPDCGHERLDVQEKIGRLRLAREAWREVLDGLTTEK